MVTNPLLYPLGTVSYRIAVAHKRPMIEALYYLRLMDSEEIKAYTCGDHRDKTKGTTLEMHPT